MSYPRGLGAFPVHAYDFDAPARAEIPNLPAKVAEYLANPIGSAMALVFNAAADLGLISRDVQGLGTLFYYQGAAVLDAQGNKTSTPVLYDLLAKGDRDAYLLHALLAKFSARLSLEDYINGNTAAFKSNGWSVDLLQQAAQTVYGSAAPLPADPNAIDPSKGTALQFLAKGPVGVSGRIAADPRLGTRPAVGLIVGYRLIHFTTRGNGVVGQWQPTPGVWSLRDSPWPGALQALRDQPGMFGLQIADLPGITGDGDGLPFVQAVAIPADHGTPDRANADEPAAFAFAQQQSGGRFQQPVEWQMPARADADLSTPVFPVPFAAIPPGSVVAVPPGGSGLPTTIKLPGTTEFIPVSAVKPQQWVDVTAPPPPGPTPVIVQTVTPSVQGGGTGGGGVVLVDGAGQPVNPDGSPPVPLQAGMSGGGLLVLAAAAFFLLPGKKSR
jgi:hypothetical protein